MSGVEQIHTHQTIKSDMISSSALPIASASEEGARKSKDLVMVAWKYFIELNIFSTVSSLNDQYELETQRIATKLFIGILLTSLLILCSYTTTVTSIDTFTITRPSFQQYKNLYQKYSQTLKCPCSQISNKYESFITIEYSRHPVCSSLFVEARWITYLGLYRGVLWRSDFRFLARQLFQALQSLCQLTKESIEISLEQFYTISHVTDVVTNEELLRLQLEAIIQEFTTTSMNKFLLSLRIIGNTTRANALLSGLFTNSKLMRGNGFYITTEWNGYDGCSCIQSSPCLEDVFIYKNGSFIFEWKMPGFYIGCLVLEALLQSDLRCFFNQTCLDDFQAHLEIDTPLALTHLDSSILHRFNPKTTIGAIVEQLMIDNWHWNINHSRYYAMCQPKQCIYRILSRESWLLIISTLVGLVGGLVTALRLIVPRVVWLARWGFKRNSRNSLDVPTVNRFSTFSRNLLEYGFGLNLFPSMPPTDDSHKLLTQRISTRIFIGTFLMSLYILLIYTATQTSIHTYIIDMPSLERYNQLFGKYSQMLTCPCSQISNKFKSFVTIEYSRHPVCSSIYITDRWITDIQTFYQTIRLSDLRYQGYQMFAALRSLCQLTEEAIKIGLDQFYASHHVTDAVSSQEILQSQAESSIQHLINSTTNNFLLSLRMVGNTTQANALSSILLTNYLFTFNTASIYLNNMDAAYDNDCACSLTSTCSTNILVGGVDLSAPVWYVPGLYRGCLIVEALRQSDLRCFYDHYCLGDLIAYMGMNRSGSYTVLEASSLKQFQEDTPIGTLVDALMVDEWRWNVSHAKYYEMCRPEKCIYTIVARNNWISILTVMFGLLGGLVTALRITVPRIVELITSQYSRKQIIRAEQIRVQQRHTVQVVLLQYFNQLNLFPSVHSATDMQKLRVERIATRVFLITFFISFMILLVYTATATVTHSYTISNPSLQGYYQLYQNYPQTLVCPCSQLTNKYRSFIDIRYAFHPICSSIYITDRWITEEWYMTETFYVRDFRFQGTYMILTLQSFCKLAETSIKFALEQFHANDYVTAVVTHSDFLHSQLNAIIQTFIDTTTNNFLLSLRLIGNTTQANAIVSAMFSNVELYMPLRSSWVDSEWAIYDDNCSCAHDSKCRSRAAMHINGSFSSYWFVPGFYRGCFLVEALRQSDLRCFTDETCLEDLRAHLEYKESISLPTLDLSSSRNFHADTPMGVIVDALMVDEWKWNVSHAKYYDVCRPRQCNYIVLGKNNVIGLVTTLIGLLGGLIKIEQFIVPEITNFVFGCMRRKRNGTVNALNTISATIASPADGLQVEDVDHGLG